MKLLITLAAITLAHAAKLDRTYLPPNAQQSSGSAFLQTPRESRYQAQPIAYSAEAYSQNIGNINAYNSVAREERPQAAFERNAAILRQDNENDGERYAYAYETENGIYAEENGVATNGVQAQGGFTYTGDDGKVYSIRYTADENGFVPQGDHLPTPPPIPEEILKSLEQNARDEAAGIYDDGSYSDAKDSTIAQQYYNSNAQPINYNAAPITTQDDAIITNAAIPRTIGNARALTAETPDKAYLPPFAQRSSNARALPAGAPQKSYLPPTQRFTSNSDDAVVTNAAIYRASANGRALPLGAPQKAYLPPTQRFTSNVEDDVVVTNAAVSRASANGRALPLGAPQKAYLPPTQRFTSNVEDDAVVTNVAFSRASANARALPLGAPQKSYLPPTQRFTSNVEDDAVVTNASVSRASVNGRALPLGAPQRAYLPPTANQRTAATARQFSFNAREGYRY